MRQEVEILLNRLIEKPIIEIGHAANMLWMGFGKRIPWANYKGKIVERSTIALHVQAPWRFLRGSQILFAQDDLFISDCACLSDVQKTRESIFEQKSKAWIKSVPDVCVVNCTMNLYHDLRIDFSNGDIFEVWSNISEDSECWRMLYFDHNHVHLVVNGNGYELIY